MANIILTNVCNASCTFCFANEFINRSQQFLSMADLQSRIDFLLSSGISQFRLLGGEPTLHPQFHEIINQIKSADLDVIIFSNGFIPKKNLEVLTNLSPKKLAVLINVNAHHPAPSFNANRQEVLSLLGKRATLGFTILNPVFDLSTYYDWIDKYGLQRKIRLGLAQPNLKGTNSYLSPKLYKIAAQSILLNAKIANQQDIQLEFDCGFVHCMFTEDEWQILDQFSVSEENHCAPNLDITLEGQIIHCFSVSQLSIPFDETMTAAEALTAVNQQREIFADVGIYPECSACEHWHSGQCCAGCLSLRLRRFHNLQALLPSG